MPGFKSGVDQLLPNLRQLLQPGAEQVNPLAAGNLGVELIAQSDLADGDQSLRSNFPGRYPRYHRIGAIFLDIGKKAIVGILQRQMLWL
ncbi:hypothetical protein D3C81_936020 [compost metagenome]